MKPASVPHARFLRTLDAAALQVADAVFLDVRLPSGRLRFSAAVVRLLGCDGEPLPATYDALVERIHPGDRDAFRDLVRQGQEKPDALCMELRIRHGNGYYIWVRSLLCCRRSLFGKYRLVLSLSDISDFKISHNQLMRATQFDQLTGLPNRNVFMESIRNLRVRQEELYAVIYLDLDRFKHVNDSLGYEAGNQFVKKIGKRLQVYEGPGDVVCRLGGDEFGFLFRSVRDINMIRELAEAILKIISLPLIISGSKIYPAASMGILIIEPGVQEPETVLKRAEAAMYRAKDLGKNRFVIYQQELSPDNSDLLQMETALRKGLDSNEFALYYQPVVSLETGLVVGFEALVRWLRPGYGLVMPGGFINFAEETGLIVPLGEWVLTEACRQHQRWRAEGYRDLHMAVNVSGYQFEQRKMLAVVARTLRDTGMAATDLNIEVTESIVMKDIEYSRQVLEDISGLGCNILIDDFGTGYSSFMYLKRFPFTILKIDQFFINDLETDPESASIVKAIIAVAHNMKLKVVAEGVENANQLRFLIDNDCDYMQGFYVSKPVPSEEAELLIGKPVLEVRGR